jgi:hypothetical protein
MKRRMSAAHWLSTSGTAATEWLSASRAAATEVPALRA